MPLRENELARRVSTWVELRPGPMRIRWDLADLATADGHELRCAFSASVRALPDKTERRMLAEVLLNGRAAVVGEDVMRHFAPALRTAVGRVAQTHSASLWLESDAPRRELIDALKSAAAGVAFACGIEVLPPFEAEVQSPTFERQRARAMQQQLAEKQAAGQVEHFARSAELFKQYNALRAAAPELSPGRILEQISPGDRGSLMGALLLASARQQEGGQKLWAAAGPYLVRVDVAGLQDQAARVPAPQLFPLPPTVGPMRSVRAANVDGRDVLLIGAQHGFLLMDPEDPSEPRIYKDDGFDSSLGFNAVIHWPSRRQFCATHSEAGLVCWEMDSTDKPVKAMRGPALGVFPPMAPIPLPEVSTLNSINMSMRAGGGIAGPRNLCLLDEQTLVLSIGAELVAWDGESARTLPRESESAVLAILPDERQLFIVREDGEICVLDRASRQIVSRERRSGRVRAAAVLPWLGSSRILLAGDEGPLQCVGFDDPLVTHYASAYRGLRAITASGSLVAAVSPDRQRLILWNSWEGRQPATEIYLGALARHRIADVAFL
ncbi:MAG TPA: hypothetical protein VFC78_21365 [Tepidisphaeraceae bacterium]|nr:hypothetical protein [Tepidisphaeraceae bacterium]